jgi:hypothetical protein
VNDHSQNPQELPLAAPLSAQPAATDVLRPSVGRHVLSTAMVGPSSRRFDPADMALRGRIGAYRLHATHDPRETTVNARAAFLGRFEREVDPEGILPQSERQRRAEYARRAYFAQLARASAVSRAKRREHRRAQLADIPTTGSSRA